jgi:hypothetical protein
LRVRFDDENLDVIADHIGFMLNHINFRAL